MTTGEKIRQLRLSQNMTLEELGNKMGVGKSTIRKWETGMVHNLKRSHIEKLAQIFNCSPIYVMGYDEESPDPPVEIPVLGQVAAGKPIIATEYIEGYEEIPRKLAATGDFFALRIHGDSMTPKIEDGDIVIVKRQNTAEDGKIVIALVEDNEAAVCKRLKIYDKNIALWSINPNYSPISATSKNQIKIIGEVVQIRRNL